MKANNLRAKGETIVVGESKHDWVQSPEIYGHRHQQSYSYRNERIPYWKWQLEKYKAQLNARPMVIVSVLDRTPKGSPWHTFKVAVITLVAAPIVLRAIPVVLDFYFAR
jgi:hypothetical protein